MLSACSVGSFNAKQFVRFLWRNLATEQYLIYHWPSPSITTAMLYRLLWCYFLVLHKSVFMHTDFCLSSHACNTVFLRTISVQTGLFKGMRVTGKKYKQLWNSQLGHLVVIFSPVIFCMYANNSMKMIFLRLFLIMF